MSGQHLKTKVPSDADLAGNPGIGAAKGMTIAGGDPEEIAGENTFEGDVENEPNDQGGVDPAHVGRVNK